MASPTPVSIIGVFVLLAASGAGCGLISSDITTVRFALPSRSYSFDTAKTGSPLPTATLPSVACADDTDCCALAAQAGIECVALVCAGDLEKTCALTATIQTPPQSVNLKKEVSALSGFESQSVLDVTISQISYDVTVNTLNVDLPPVELFVGPDGTTTTAGATKFGTVPSTPAGTTITGGLVQLDRAGQDAFVGFAHHFGTPFVFLAKTTLLAPGGTPIPSGAVSLTVRGQLAAKPGF